MQPINSPDGLFHDETFPGSLDGTIITAAWCNAIQLAVMGLSGDQRTLAVESTILSSDGIIYANPADGVTVLYHLPLYADVSANKLYRIKNIGQGIARIDAADAKTIDKEALLDLAPGDRCELAKDGVNWQTI